MYSLQSFGLMVADEVRMSAYTRALEATVRPGSIVVDIGAGTGVLSLVACRLGARRVYAVEPNPAVEIAAESARANGFEDRIVIVRGMSTDLELGERADVVVSDLRGILPLWEHHIATVVDARARLLAPGGALIPQQDRILAAVITAPGDYEQAAGPWTNRFGVDLSAGRRWVLNSFSKSRFTPAQLLTAPALAATLDYTLLTDATLDAELRWTVSREGTAHGIGAWFETVLFGDVGFSNAPGEAEALYGRAFFPWLSPVGVAEGDEVCCRLSAWLVDDNYVWRWTSSVVNAAGNTIAEFDQSTFWAWPLDVKHLQRGSSQFVPAPTPDMQADAFVLANVDGTRSLGDISRELMQRFPDRFGDHVTALNHVALVSRRYQ